jgi:hypothetical protein
MKVLKITTLVLLLGFVAIQIFAMRSQSKIEMYPYTVIKKYKTFEIRNYEASLFTTVKMSTSEYDQASRKGFSTLAGYIFGGNETNEKIAMTSPVAMSLDDSITMMFMVPRNLTQEMLPKPNDENIQFRQVPQKTVAAISFGGWASDKKIQKYKNLLVQELKNEGILHTQSFYYLGYNPPYEVFNRRNEIIVELIQLEKNQ